jgi:RNA polymerase sigma factor (sigma-70 family)
MMLEDRRKALVAWVAYEVMPHEPAVRDWLRRRRVPPDDINDLIQEAYAKLSAIEGFEQVRRPDSFFFQTVRNLLLDQLRRAKVVRIDLTGDFGPLWIRADEPSPEASTAARRELAVVAGLISRLPDRCRTIFQMRRIDGLSQRETAQALGITESIVENEALKAVRLIMKSLRQLEDGDVEGRAANDRATNRL